MSYTSMQEKTRHRVYVASFWRNTLQPDVVSALRQDGHEVYDFKNPAPGEKGFSWSEISDSRLDWTADDFAGYVGFARQLPAGSESPGSLPNYRATDPPLVRGRNTPSVGS